MWFPSTKSRKAFITRTAQKPRTRQSKEPVDVSAYSDAEDDIPWFQEQPANEVTRFTTVFEIPRARLDSDSTFHRTSQTYLTKDAHLPAKEPESDIHLPVENLKSDIHLPEDEPDSAIHVPVDKTDSDANLPIDSPSHKNLLMTKVQRRPCLMLLQWARETLAMMVKRVKRIYLTIPQTVDRRTL